MKRTETCNDGTYLSHNRGWKANDIAWTADHITALLKRNSLNFHRAVDLACGADGLGSEIFRQHTQDVMAGHKLKQQLRLPGFACYAKFSLWIYVRYSLMILAK